MFIKNEMNSDREDTGPDDATASSQMVSLCDCELPQLIGWKPSTSFLHEELRLSGFGQDLLTEADHHTLQP